MQRFFIQIVNVSLLFFILVGVPAATRAQLGNWQISSAPAARLLIFLGLGSRVGRQRARGVEAHQEQA